MADSRLTIEATLIDDERIRDIVREEIAEHERRRALGALGTLSKEHILELLRAHAEAVRQDVQQAIEKGAFPP